MVQDEMNWLVLTGLFHLIDLLALGAILAFGSGQFLYPSYYLNYTVLIILAPLLAGTIASLQIKNLKSDNQTELYISQNHWWLLRIPGINSVFFTIRCIEQSLKHGKEPIKKSLGVLDEIFQRSGLADHSITTYLLAHYFIGPQVLSSYWTWDFFKVALLVKFCTSMIKLIYCVKCNVSRNLMEINSTWVQIVLVIEAAIYTVYIVLLYVFAAHGLKYWTSDFSILAAPAIIAIPTVLFSIGKACEVNGFLNFEVLGRGFESAVVYSNDQIGRFSLSLEIIACYCIGVLSYGDWPKPPELGFLEPVNPAYILSGLLILRLTITTARNFVLRRNSVSIETEKISTISDSDASKKKFFNSNISQAMPDVHTSSKKPTLL